MQTMDLRINKNSNRNKPFKEGKVYIIYYYPPDIIITQDPELLKLFRGSKDRWTIIANDGQSYEIDAILLFYGLPIRKKELEKLKGMDDKELEYYYQNALTYLFSTLTNYKPGFIKKIADKLAFRKPKGKPIKIKDIDEDIELNQGDAIQRAFNYYQQAQKLGSIYAEITKAKKWSFGGLNLSFFKNADIRTVVNIGVAVIIVAILVVMLIVLHQSFFNTFSNIHTMANITNTLGHTYKVTNPIG